MSDDVFSATTSAYQYDLTLPLNPKVESLKNAEEDWIHEVVYVDTPTGSDRLPIHLMWPRNIKPPYHAVIYFSGLNSTQDIPFEYELTMNAMDFIPKSGRVLAVPILAGLWDRSDGSTLGKLLNPVTSRKLIGQFGQDLGRTIDYLV